MLRNSDSAAHGVPLLFNMGFLATALLLLAGRLVSRNVLLGLASASSRAFISVSGYFRHQPDPWLEFTLRDAFAEFDRDLAAILDHEQAPR
ncbi:MAG TPA: hypothetical protein VMU95_07350 [Trebonia sp.]|nr:hypothetical protein [Trebonia sp.]